MKTTPQKLWQLNLIIGYYASNIYFINHPARKNHAQTYRPKIYPYHGAGPIVIGQACEFDYSGAQACKPCVKKAIKSFW